VPENLREQNDEDFAADEEEAEEEDIAPVARQHNTRTIEIERFLPAGQIDARYFEKPYYLVPREMIGQESFAVIRDAMSREGVIGLARIVLSSREGPFLIGPMDAGLRGVTLRFSHEVRSLGGIFQRSS
jgi:DNA end-binding protein Ku